MLTQTVVVTQDVSVTVDETKFTEDFMQEFRESFFNFDSIDDHLEHLAQLYARGLVSDWDPEEFIEGYGPMKDMGIKFEIIDQSSEITS
jgi:hypothetical protein